MAFNATFKNILVISCRLDLLVEETRVPGENHTICRNMWRWYIDKDDYSVVMIGQLCVRVGRHIYRELLFLWASTINNPTKYVGLVQSGPHHHLIEN